MADCAAAYFVSSVEGTPPGDADARALSAGDAVVGPVVPAHEATMTATTSARRTITRAVIP